MGSLGGGLVHFNLYSTQFLSDCKTLWGGDLCGCHRAVNFFMWLSELLNPRFWHGFNKTFTFLGIEATQAWLKKVQKKVKNDQKIIFSKIVSDVF